ncbi:MAG: thiamine-binding protein [Ornithinimicrobium sp.]
MLFAFSIAPAGSDESDGSVSEAVAEAVRIVRDSGLPNETTAMFTTLEGEWDECMVVIKDACDAVARHSSRVSLVLKADLRPGYTEQLTGKVDRVEAHLAQRPDSRAD